MSTGRPRRRAVQRINEAYEVLSDPDRRAAYDRYRSCRGQWVGGRAIPSDFGAVRRSAISSKVSSEARPRGPSPDVAPRAVRTFRSRSISLRGSRFRRREGSRTDPAGDLRRLQRLADEGPASGTTALRDLWGTGEVRRVQQTILGQFMSPRPARPVTARACRSPIPAHVAAAGSRHPFAADHGHDSSRNRRNATLRLSGQGEAGPAAGPTGNLFVKVRDQTAPVSSLVRARHSISSSG